MAMLPDHCMIKENDRWCVNPPEFIVSIVVDSDEYMVGVTCMLHKNAVYNKVASLQGDGYQKQQQSIPLGKINFTKLKAVGTDCIKGHIDDEEEEGDASNLIQIK